MSDGPLEIRFHLRAKPKSEEAQATTAVGRLPQITRVLALAIYFDDLLRQGHAKDYADIGRLNCLCRERVSQIMRLNYLAADIQIELLYLPPMPAGDYPIAETALRKIANLLSWNDQRRHWAELKGSHRLG